MNILGTLTATESIILSEWGIIA